MPPVFFTPQSFQLLHQLTGTLAGAGSGGLPYAQARSSLGRILSDPLMMAMRNSGDLPYQMRGVERFIAGEDYTATRLTALAMRFATFREALKSKPVAAIPMASPLSSLPSSLMPPSQRAETLVGRWPTKGENREITATFVDIVGYSAMGEELSHDEVFPVLNDVLERSGVDFSWAKADFTYDLKKIIEAYFLRTRMGGLRRY